MEPVLYAAALEEDGRGFTPAAGGDIIEPMGADALRAAASGKKKRPPCNKMPLTRIIQAERSGER